MWKKVEVRLVCGKIYRIDVNTDTYKFGEFLQKVFTTRFYVVTGNNWGQGNALINTDHISSIEIVD